VEWEFSCLAISVIATYCQPVQDLPHCGPMWGPPAREGHQPPPASAHPLVAMVLSGAPGASLEQPRASHASASRAATQGPMLWKGDGIVASSTMVQLSSLNQPIQTAQQWPTPRDASVSQGSSPGLWSQICVGGMWSVCGWWLV